MSGHDPRDSGAGPRWWRAFPGEAAQLRVLRRWIEDLLPPCQARDDLIEVACELAANAVRHTLSGDGGQFGIRITPERGLVVVAVADGGGAIEPRVVADPLGEHGRGLRIVHALSDWVTVDGGAKGRLVTAAVPWPLGADAPGAEPEHEVGEGLAMLRELFPGVPVWYGHATGEWWAVIRIERDDRLIGAPKPGNLAALVSALHAGPVAVAGLGLS